MFKNNHTIMYWLILPIKIYGERWCMSQLRYLSDPTVKNVYNLLDHMRLVASVRP